MKKWKVNLSNLTGNTTAKLMPKLKKVAITAIAAASLTFGLQMAPQASGTETKTDTVYYVYFNNEYVGMVSDKKIIQSVVDSKIEEIQNQYNGLNLSADSQLKFVPEKVFRSSIKTSDNKVANELKTQFTVKAESTALVLDGQPAAYLDSPQSADEVIKTLKLNYVTPAEYDAYIARTKDPLSAGQPLAENETRIKDIRLTKEVSYSSTKVSPDQIMSVEQVVQLLKNGTVEQQKYAVKDGDVLGSIANSNGLTLQQIIEINPGLTAESVLKPDQEVNITVLKPFVDVIIEKESLVKEPISYASEIVNDASIPKGQRSVSQQGQNGERQASYQIVQQNGQTITRQEISSNVLKEPVNEIIINGTKVIPSRGDGSLAWPTVGGYVSSPMGPRGGKMHKGIDIARPSNHTIKAADNGVVVSAGYDGGYGNKIVIDHQNGMRTVYAHLSSMGVSVGQTVAKGSAIGVMGSTGNSTGVHLHFEVYKNGSLQNPRSFLN